MGRTLGMGVTYLSQWFDISGDSPVGYLRGHPNHSKFESIYRDIERACAAYSAASPKVDIAVLLGRHMRLGPEPPWVVIWRIEANSALNDLRMQSPVASSRTHLKSQETWAAIGTGGSDFGKQRAEHSSGVYYAAWFRPKAAATSADVETAMKKEFGRASGPQRPDGLLALLRRTSSRKVPASSEATHWVLWRLPGLSTLDDLSRSGTPAAESCLYRVSHLVNGAIYRDFGDEQL